MNNKTNNIFDVISSLVHYIKDSIFEGKVYLVGGAVRDIIMGNQTINDIDLVVDYSNGGIRLCEFLCDKYPNVFKNLAIFETYGTCKIDM